MLMMMTTLLSNRCCQHHQCLKLFLWHVAQHQKTQADCHFLNSNLCLFRLTTAKLLVVVLSFVIFFINFGGLLALSLSVLGLFFSMFLLVITPFSKVEVENDNHFCLRPLTLGKNCLTLDCATELLCVEILVLPSQLGILQAFFERLIPLLSTTFEST